MYNDFEGESDDGLIEDYEEESEEEEEEEEDIVFEEEEPQETDPELEDLARRLIDEAFNSSASSQPWEAPTSVEEWDVSGGAEGTWSWFRKHLEVPFATNPVLGSKTKFDDMLDFILWLVQRKVASNMPVREFAKIVDAFRCVGIHAPASWEQVKKIIGVGDFYNHIHHLCDNCGTHRWPFLAKKDYKNCSEEETKCPNCNAERFKKDARGTLMPKAWVFEIPLQEAIQYQLFGNLEFCAEREEYFQEILEKRPEHVFRFSKEGKRIDDHFEKKCGQRPLESEHTGVISIFYDEIQAYTNSVGHYKTV